MIELKIQDDLASYIDTEELQRTAEYEVKNTIRNTVTRMAQSDETIQKIIESAISKKLSEVRFSDDLEKLIEQKIINAIDAMNDWNIGYAIKMDNKISDMYQLNQDRYDTVITRKVSEYITGYEINKYQIDNVITNIATELIMNQSDGVDIKQKLEMFVKNGLESIMEQLSYA